MANLSRRCSLRGTQRRGEGKRSKQTMYRTVGIMLVALVSHGAAFSFAGIGMGRVAPKPLNLNMMAADGKKEVLIVGGTRFSGL